VLKLLAVHPLPGERVRTLARIHVEGEVDIHSHCEEHGSSRVEDEIVRNLITAAVSRRFRVDDQFRLHRRRDVGLEEVAS
jgi:hypothetical protein